MSVQDAYAPPRAAVRDLSGATGVVSERVIAALRKTRPWVLLIAVLGFIGAAFMVLASLPMFLGLGMSGMEGLEGSGMYGAGFMIGMGLVYLLFGAIYFMASLYLLRFANAIKRAVTGLSIGDLETAMESQASFWKLVGILSVISIGVVILMFVVGIGSLFMLGNTP